MIKTLKIFLIILLILTGCSKEEKKMETKPNQDWKKFALEFANNLANRNYKEAYSMTSLAYQKTINLDQFKEEFEEMIPLDWGEISPIELGETMDDWPDKKASDLIWVYISLGGDVYSEAVIVVISYENKNLKISEVEFGRP